MADIVNREELLNRLMNLMHDPRDCEVLQLMSDAQLKILAETFDDTLGKSERRDTARRAVMRRVQVSAAEGNAFGTQYGLQEDISANGIGLFLGRPVPLRGRVRIQSAGMDLVGTVQRCQQEKGGWRIGVLLERPAGPTGEKPPEVAGDSVPPAESGPGTGES
jgi:hypothetical protein